MIRKFLSHIAPLVAVALLAGASTVSHADEIYNFGYYGPQDEPTLYAELDVWNVAGKTNPNSWFYVTDGYNFSCGSFDTVQFTKDKDGTVHTTMKGYGIYNDDFTVVYVEEHLTRKPNGSSSLSVQFKPTVDIAALSVSSIMMGQQVETPMVYGTTCYLPGK